MNKDGVLLMKLENRICHSESLSDQPGTTTFGPTGIFLAVIAIGAGLLVSFGVETAFAQTSLRDAISGQASVIDGDTIEIGGARIRLHAIDAPESRQTCTRNGTPWRCGQQSALALADFIGKQVVVCEKQGIDRYKRILAICYRGAQRSVDLNAWMVEQGWALSYRRFSDLYADQEEKARQARRGIWSSEFEAPWEWRRRKG
jgi:endonuclease YncB( thermonuclease family)